MRPHCASTRLKALLSPTMALQVVRADASSQPVPPSILSSRAGRLARTLARTAAANMLRRDVRTPFAVELAQQPTVRQKKGYHTAKPNTPATTSCHVHLYVLWS